MRHILILMLIFCLTACAAPMEITPTPTSLPTEKTTPTTLPTLKPTATATAKPTATPDVEATKQAEFETRKAEALKMVSIKLDSPEDFNTLPVLDDVADFDSGKVQEAEYWLIDNVLPPSDTKLPESWRAETNEKSGYCNMMYNLISEGNVDNYRGVGAFFVIRDGKKMLRLGVEYGGGQGSIDSL